MVLQKGTPILPQNITWAYKLINFIWYFCISDVVRDFRCLTSQGNTQYRNGFAVTPSAISNIVHVPHWRGLLHLKPLWIIVITYNPPAERFHKTEIPTWLNGCARGISNPSLTYGNMGCFLGVAGVNYFRNFISLHANLTKGVAPELTITVIIIGGISSHDATQRPVPTLASEQALIYFNLEIPRSAAIWPKGHSQANCGTEVRLTLSLWLVRYLPNHRRTLMEIISSARVVVLQANPFSQ